MLYQQTSAVEADSRRMPATTDPGERKFVSLCGLVVAEGAYPQPAYPIRRDCSAKAFKYVVTAVMGV